MPKQPINYSNTIIYKIVCKDITITDCYVGQTTNFSERKKCHNKRCNFINNKYFNLYVYQFIRENGGWDNWSMIEIEKYMATDKLDVHKRERFWIETLKAKLNKKLPTRTLHEYYEANKEHHKLIMKNIREKNKEQIKEYNKKYREQNKEKDKLYREQNKERIKEYNEQNKDKHNEQQRLRRALKKKESIESSL
ncbi:MAG: Yellowstone Lake virophage 6 [Pseudomonadota bacterium]|jgi:hypothetical protein